MICKNCFKKDVCKHYIYLKENDGLILSDCKYAFLISNNQIKKNYTEPKTVPLKNNVYRETISDKIQKINSKNDITPDFKVVSKLTKLEKCPSCGADVYKEDITICDKCKKNICSVCGIKNFDCDNQVFINLCDDCWSNINEDETTKDNNIIDINKKNK